MKANPFLPSSLKIAALRAQRATIGREVHLGFGSKINADQLDIGDRSRLGRRTVVRGAQIWIGQGVFIGDDVELRARLIEIGDFTEVRKGVRIVAYERFKIGRMGTIGQEADFHVREAVIGDDFYSDDNPIPLRIGGGGSAGPRARITIGNRCVMHDNHINVCEPVTIGDDVGFSPDATIYTHGFWNSVLEGYPATFAPVTIGDHVWLGFRCIVLPGVTIGNGAIVGAGAVVTSNVPPKSVVAGVPAKVIRGPPDFPRRMPLESCDDIMKQLMSEYADLLRDKGFRVSIVAVGDAVMLRLGRNGEASSIVYSKRVFDRRTLSAHQRALVLSFENCTGLCENDAFLDLRTLTFTGRSDDLLSDFRDFLRRRGIKFYGERFKSIAPQLSKQLWD